jgi:hypothetical protein
MHYALYTLDVTMLIPHGREYQVQKVIADDGEACALHDRVTIALQEHTGDFVRHLNALDAAEYVLESMSRDLLDLGDPLVEVVHGGWISIESIDELAKRVKKCQIVR